MSDTNNNNNVVAVDDFSVKTIQQNVNEKEKPERGHWGHYLEFYLATLGYTVGISEITRFPYLCMKNGGGAFLIPFLVAMFITGIPLFYLEVALGQFSGGSPLTMWSLCPIFKGVGYACLILSAIVGIYYNIMITWCVYYLYQSFAHDVPWRGCKNSWNTEKCYDPFSAVTCVNVTLSDNITTTRHVNCTQRPDNFLLPSEDFLNNVVLGVRKDGGGIDNIGSLRWPLVLCLLASWTVVFLCQMKGVKTSGKVVYITATLPYVLLTALVIRGFTLDGAVDGLIFYLKPNFTTLLNPDVWIEAALQMFFSLGPSWGGLITMSSYNKFNHRIIAESLGIPFSDLFTALYGGLAVFSVIGFMSKHANMPIERFAASGPTLSFVVFPQAIAELPVSPLWSICFFLMLLTLGIDSQFGFVEPVICGLCDVFPNLRRYKTTITAIMCSICFLIGLPFCAENGIYLYTLIDWYTAAITVTVVAFLEIIAVSYFYGLERFTSDVKLMLGKRPNILWRLCWLIFTPIFLAALLFLGLWNLRAPSYQGYKYPTWAIAVGWLVALVSTAPIPILAIHAIITSPHKSWRSKLTSVFRPTDKWLPAKPELVEKYRATYYYKDDAKLLKFWLGRNWSWRRFFNSFKIWNKNVVECNRTNNNDNDYKHDTAL